MIASAALLRPPECTTANTPDSTATRIFTINVPTYSPDALMTSTAIRFHTPVTTVTTKAGQATRPKAWASGRTASGAMRLAVGTRPAITN